MWGRGQDPPTFPQEDRIPLPSIIPHSYHLLFPPRKVQRCTPRLLAANDQSGPTNYSSGQNCQDHSPPPQDKHASRPGSPVIVLALPTPGVPPDRNSWCGSAEDLLPSPVFLPHRPAHRRRPRTAGTAHRTSDGLACFAPRTPRWRTHPMRLGASPSPRSTGLPE